MRPIDLQQKEDPSQTLSHTMGGQPLHQELLVGQNLISTKGNESQVIKQIMKKFFSGNNRRNLMQLLYC